jgi:hypothetical protein
MVLFSWVLRSCSIFSDPEDFTTNSELIGINFLFIIIFLAAKWPTYTIILLLHYLSTLFKGKIMSKYKKWNTEEIEFIRNNHNSAKDNDLANQLSKVFNTCITASMVRRQRRKLGLVKKRGRPCKNLVTQQGLDSVDSVISIQNKEQGAIL